MLKNKKIWASITCIVLLIILAGSVMFYFYRQTPRYTFILIQDAIKDHDVQAFNRHVDTEKLLSKAYDDLIATDFESEKSTMLQGIATMVKPAVIPALQWQIRLFVEHGKEDFSDNKMQTESKTADVFKKKLNLQDIHFKKVISTKEENGKAHVTILLEDKKLQKEFNLEMEMEQLEDKTWKILNISNLPTYLQELKTARKEKLTALNQPIKENIMRQISCEIQELNFRKVNFFIYSGDVDLKVLIKANADKEIDKISLQCHLKNKEGIKITLPFTIDIHAKTGEKTVILSKNLNRLVEEENAILKSSPVEIEKTLEITSLRYQDQTSIELLTKLP